MPTHDLAIGFDADDTLWHNEIIFEKVHDRYRALLSRYHDAATVNRTLLATEIRNLAPYGYGVKGFTLSAIETAIQLTEGEISAREIQQLIELGREMIAHPVELIEGVADILVALGGRHRLLLITKGDLHEQERKVARSGLAAHFERVEIVSEKNEASYATILRRHAIPAERFLMVGNSLKSDILPVLAIGGAAAHVPYALTWAAENATAPSAETRRFFALKSLSELPGVIAHLAEG